MRIRKEASQAADDLRWYGKAVTRLKATPVPGTELDMWTLQASMHNSVDVGGNTIECIHGSWFFLPWHRAYLLAFEAVVAQAVSLEGGPADDWALPYWNYGDASTRSYPDAFVNPNDASNPLWVDERSPAGPDENEADSLTCLDETAFSTQVGGFGFGGPPTGMIHSGGAPGAVENLPHNAVHRAVGGVMATYTSPLDPIFWLHHANIDRLWEVWRAKRRNATGQLPDPSDDAWLQQPFQFLRFDGSTVSSQAQDLLDTRAIGYRYDPDPLAAQPSGLFRAARRGVRPGAALAEPRVEQMLGATGAPLVVGQQPSSIEIPTDTPQAPPSRMAFALMAARGPQFYLRLENVRSPEGIPGTYAAYLNLDPNAQPGDYPQLRAGLIPGFGIAEASQNDGLGVTVTLEVTDVVNYLSQQQAWDPALLRVTLAPYNAPPPTNSAVSPQITVGRISVHIL